MIVLVTGGSGRLGRSVVTELAQAGHGVINADLQQPRAPLPGEFREIDVLDRERLTQLARDVDVIIHLAGIAEPFSKSEDEIYFVNGEGTKNVFEAALTSENVRTIIYAGSVNPIGYSNPRGWTPSYLPLDERHPVAPWNAYTASKVAGEVNLQRTVDRSDYALKGFTVRPCFVVAPEEWAPDVPGQGGKTIWERLDDPNLAATTFFNYIDARDAAALFVAILRKAESLPNGMSFFAAGPDPLARQPMSLLLPQHYPAAAPWADQLTGTKPAISIQNARRRTGWRPVHSWTRER